MISETIGKGKAPYKKPNDRDRDRDSRRDKEYDSRNDIGRSQKNPAKDVQDSKDDSSFVRAPEDPLKSKLKAEANKWVKDQTEKNKDDKRKIENNIRANLNKLTPDNFDKVKLEILESAKISIEVCQNIVQQIIEKSWTEQKYAETYAKLCSFLQNDKTLYFGNDGKGEKEKNKTLFKSELLGRIQNAFENDEVCKSKGVV